MKFSRLSTNISDQDPYLFLCSLSQNYRPATVLFTKCLLRPPPKKNKLYRELTIYATTSVKPAACLCLTGRITPSRYVSHSVSSLPIDFWSLNLVGSLGNLRASILPRISFFGHSDILYKKSKNYKDEWGWWSRHQDLDITFSDQKYWQQLLFQQEKVSKNSANMSDAFKLCNYTFSFIILYIDTNLTQCCVIRMIITKNS